MKNGQKQNGGKHLRNRETMINDATLTKLKSKNECINFTIWIVNRVTW